MSSKQEIPLYDQLLRECDAMAKHAFASGLRISPLIVQKLERHLGESWDRKVPDAGDTAPAENAHTRSSRPAARARPALTELAMLHQALITVVAPATPRTILLLAEESAKKHALSFLGSVPLVRHMMVAAMGSLVGVICISLSSEVDEDNMRQSLLQLSGRPLFLIEMFLVSAAGLGASFSALFTVNHYIVQGTYDPKYKASYWVRFFLGIIAGLILADFVPADASTQAHVHKPLLAILGGFSASVVYRILSRLVDTVESVFRGDPRDQLAASEVATKAQIAAQAAQTSIRVASRLMTLQQELGDEADPKRIRSSIDQAVAELVPADLAIEPTAESTDQEDDDGGKKRKAKS